MDSQTDDISPNSDSEGPSQVKSANPQSTIESLLQRYGYCIWPACSIVSVISARCLLIEQGFHYPVHLYIYQIVVTAAFSLFLHTSRRNFIFPNEKKLWSMRSAQLMAATYLLLAMAMFCALQAILHFTNLPILIMLTTIAFFAEGLLLVFIKLTPFSRVELFRLSLLGCACAGILSFDHRLKVPGLVSSILAMLFTGSASALRKLNTKLYQGRTADLTSESKWLVATCSLVAIAWCLSPLNTEKTLKFDIKLAPLITINACSTAATAVVGTSIFFPRDRRSSIQKSTPVDLSLQTLGNMAMLMTITAVVGCYSTLVVRRSYTSWDQVWFFIFAMLCVSGKAFQGVYMFLSKHRSTLGGTYQPIDHALPRAYDNGIALFVEESATNNLELPRAYTRSFNGGMSLASFGLVMLWIPYLYLNFKQKVVTNHVVLDQHYESKLATEVVISMYNEPIDDVAELIQNLRGMPLLSGVNVTIYIKDANIEIETVKRQTKADDVVVLPNIGREGETYLNHVLARWDTLATQTIFLQAHIHNPREFYARFNRYYRPSQTGFLSLGWSGVVCDIEDCSDEFSWRDETHLFPRIQARVDQSATDPHALLNYKGQFVVSAARIRGIDQNIYRDLRQALVDEKSWAHQEPYLQGRKDSMSQPLFGYTMERIWNLLFQCSDMQVAWKCPSLISGWRPGGDISDCQCFDS